VRWCCSIFEGFVDCVGERGMTIIVGTIAGRDTFVLQFRAVEVGDSLGYTEVPVAVEGHQAIHHCPGCGARLAKCYKKNLDALRRQDMLEV
jgi:hypothetical protein